MVRGVRYQVIGIGFHSQQTRHLIPTHTSDMPKVSIATRKFGLLGAKIQVDLTVEEPPKKVHVNCAKLHEISEIRDAVIHVCNKDGAPTAMERREAVRLYHALMDWERDLPNSPEGDVLRDVHGRVTHMLVLNFPKVRKSLHPNPKTVDIPAEIYVSDREFDRTVRITATAAPAIGSVPWRTRSVGGNRCSPPVNPIYFVVQ
jgi:hypothetical protein